MSESVEALFLLQFYIAEDNIMRQLASKLNKVAILIAIVLIASNISAVSVKANTTVSVVMTYGDKVFTKQLYEVDVEQIKSGANTDGLKSIGDLCDNLTFQTNGGASVDKNSVIDAVKDGVKAGKTSINIDLTKYTPEAVAALKAQAMQNAMAAQAAVTGNTSNNTASTATGNMNDLVLNSTLMAMGIDCKISEASTKFNAREDRAVNVRNAASKINGMILAPGQVVSANQAFMPRTSANGYGLGNVISGGQYVKAMGGGICQVSSTLNLAVLRAGIVPMERHNHSHRSGYIGSGLDATISAGTLDYKFANTLAYPIYISAVTDGGVLTVSIYSNHDALMGVTFEPKVVGDKMSNTTYLVGTLNGVEVSNVKCYSSKYKQ